MKAAVLYALEHDGDFGPQNELIAAGYTHIVTVFDREDYEANYIFADVIDIVEFTNEFAAQTYADAINMGVIQHVEA